MNQNHHVAVIGAGPGGYAAAFMAADLGMKVTLIDKNPNPGGVCLYRGCIPSKAYLHASSVINEARHASTFGVEFGEPKISREKLVAWKNSIVDQLTGGLGQLSKKRKIHFIQGKAQFIDPHTLDVEGQEVRFDSCIIATGSRPVVPGPWQYEDPRIMDSTAALEMEEIPSSLLVIGGGYIGLELGCVYSTLGSKVSVVEMASRLVPGADADLTQILHQELTKKFSAILTDTKVAQMEPKEEGIEVQLEGPEGPSTQIFDRVLVSVGRRPNNENIGLENCGIQLDERGFIPIDGQCRTRVPHLYAIGDITGDPMLAHRATHQGRLAAEVIHGSKAHFEPLCIPAVMFTDPELAWVGYTEAEAKAKGLDYKAVKFPWAASGRAKTLGSPTGVTKLLIDKQSERILGLALVGPHAGDMIAEGALAIEMGATAEDLSLTIHPHPTLSESIMETADLFFGNCTHLAR